MRYASTTTPLGRKLETRRRIGAVQAAGGRPAILLALTCLALLLLTGCGSAGESSDRRGATIDVLLAWYPTPEYGGLYAAQSQGFFKKQGITVNIMPGGPQVSPTEVVGAGHADIGYLANDEDLMEANDNGIAVTEFATTYQVFPGAIEYHLSHPISTLQQVNGKVISGVTGSVSYEWLKHLYHLHNTVTPFSYATFGHNADSLLLGFAPNDVPTLAAQGVKVGYLPTAKSGLEPYADILFAKSGYVSHNTALIKRFLLALGKGWQYFHSHYLQVDAVIFKAEPTTPLAVDNQIAKMEMSFIYSGAAKTSGIGSISISRVRNTYSKLRELMVLKHDLNIGRMVNATLVPKLLAP